MRSRTPSKSTFDGNISPMSRLGRRVHGAPTTDRGNDGYLADVERAVFDGPIELRRTKPRFSVEFLSLDVGWTVRHPACEPFQTTDGGMFARGPCRLRHRGAWLDVPAQYL